MPPSRHSGFIMPRGLIVDHVETGPGLTIIARPVAASVRCPNCDQPSSRVHSHDTRTLSDLPVAGRRVVIAIRVRRFRCVGSDYRAKILAERLGSDRVAACARRRARLEGIVHHLGHGRSHLSPISAAFAFLDGRTLLGSLERPLARNQFAGYERARPERFAGRRRRCGLMGVSTRSCSMHDCSASITGSSARRAGKPANRSHLRIRRRFIARIYLARP